MKQLGGRVLLCVEGYTFIITMLRGGDAMREKLLGVLTIFKGNVDTTVERLGTATDLERVAVEAMIEPLILLGLLVRKGESVQLAVHPNNARYLVHALLDAAESGVPAIPNFEKPDAESSWMKIVHEIDKWLTTPVSRHLAMAMVLIVGEDPSGERWVLCRVDTKDWKELKLPIGKVEFWPVDKKNPLLETREAHVGAREALLSRFRHEFFLDDLSQYLQLDQEPFAKFDRQESSVTKGPRTAYHIRVHEVESYMPHPFPYPAGSTLAWLHRDRLAEIFQPNSPRIFFPDGTVGGSCLLKIDKAKKPYRMDDGDLAHVVGDSVLEELADASKKRAEQRPTLS